MRLLPFLLLLTCTVLYSRILHAEITLLDSGTHIELSNDDVSITIEKSRARITKLLHKGQSLLAPGQTGYFTILALDKGGSSQNLSINNCAYTIHLQNDTTIDLSFKPPKPAEFPFDMDFHFVLRDGESGFYFYLVAEKSGDRPDAVISQFRYAMRVDHSMLNIRLNDKRSGTICSVDEIKNAQGTVMDATYMLQNGEYRTKYEWSSPTDEAPVYGLNNGTQGIWMIRGGNESLNGGPTKQHNTCHGTDKGPILLNLLYSSHYGSNGSYVSGEWEKIFGPTYVYLNQSSNADSLWADAKQEGEKMREAWPYAWLDHPEYPVERASVSGKFPIIDTGWVVLARPYWFRGLDWQKQGGDSYTYRSRINKDGSFTIPAVRKGTYTLYAFAPGIVGEYYKDNIEVDSTGETQLGNMPWKSRSYGKVLWKIGKPDRSAAEFKYGDDHYHWGLWFNYLNDFPNDVDFIVGESNEQTDWNYGHMAMWIENGGWKPKLDGSVGEGEWKEPVWKIRFNVDDTIPGFATLSLALAGVSREANLHLTLNGSPLVSYKNLTDDSSIHRNGIYGFYRERIFTFDASQLKIGENILELELEIVKLPNKRTNYSFGVMYDYIQLEVEEKDNTGTGATTEALEAEIYPNPAEENFYIQLPGHLRSGELRLFNIAGQKVMSEILTDSHNRIDLQSFASGLYIVEIEADGIISKNKLMVR